MIKQLLIAVLLLMTIISISSTESIDTNRTISGFGTWSVYNSPSTDTEYFQYHNDLTGVIYCSYNAYLICTYFQGHRDRYCERSYPGGSCGLRCDTGTCTVYDPSGTNICYNNLIESNHVIYIPYQILGCGNWDVVTQITTITVSDTPLTAYTISGNLDCITDTLLYQKKSDDSYILVNENDSSSYYSFNILNTCDYKLVFSDGHEYEFTCTGDINYDYDACSWMTLNFRDNCGNLLRETEFQYCNHKDTIVCYFKNTSSGSYDIAFEDQDYLEIWAYSHIGKLYYNISNPQDISYSVNNPTIAWNNNIYVIDGNTTHIIEDALVIFNQDCIIDSSSYPSRIKYTDIDGYAKFDQCELDSFSIDVSATGYKSFSDTISSINLNAYKLGQTIIVKLYPTGDEANESEYTESDYGTWIKFKDIDGYYTTSILDNDTYIDLYYYNNNSEGTSMTLKFQKYNIYTGLIDILSWNIPHGENSYKRILKSNYTDYTYTYRGYLYNTEIDGWNRIKYLEVRNETKEKIDHYQNLSTILWFVNKNSEGSIDYKEDISIIAYANSSNSSLLEISLELYNNSVYVDHINLTWADFVSADVKWFYEWNPDHSYVNGHNYTVRMHGYDYYLLETDFINASDYRKNKLTIIVKDRTGNNLNNSYIFLEGYGSLSTGISYYNSYEGLDNGDYRYKAFKSGYAGAGWDNINLADGDEIVAYILTSDTGNTTYTPVKTSDADIQSFFFPMMFILFIFILMGAFRYVCS